MQAKWLNGFNESTQQNEQFYPITHKDAIIGAEEFVLTEEADEIEGEIPDIDPVVNNRINEIIAYVNEKLAHAGSGSGGSGSTAPAKLEMYTLHVIATTDSQTTFGISLSDFDSSRDYVLVQSERLMLSPDLDFTINGKNIILNEGVENGRNITIYVFKSADKDDEENGGGSFSVLDIPDGTITLKKLVEPVLPLSGGTMTGNLYIQKQSPTLWLDNTDITDGRKGMVQYTSNQEVDIVNRMSATNRSSLRLAPETSNLSDLLKLTVASEVDSSVGGSYKIYGEHNPQASNNNILINSNFKEPVNQRNISFPFTSSESSVYCIDKWRLTSGTINKTQNGITLIKSGNSEAGILQQRFEGEYGGKTLTITGKFDGVIHKFTVAVTKGENAWHNCGKNNNVQLYVRRYDSTWSDISIYCYGDTPITIEWFKVEEGKYATPYIARSYLEELTLCQRTFYQGYVEALPYQVGGSTLWFSIPIKTTLVRTPTVIINTAYLYKNNVKLEGFTQSIAHIDKDRFNFGFTKSSHGLTFSDCVVAGVYYAVDAEL